MSKEINNLKNYPRNPKDVLNDIQLECEKDIYKLQFSQLCEVVALSEILSNAKIITALSKQFDKVTFHNGKGADICFVNNNTTRKLKIEIKGSLLKNDYMNKTDKYKYKNAKEVKFWGNGVKQKDFSSDTGTLIADIVILVCCDEEDKNNITPKTKWEFLIFDNEEIQKLEPKSTVFFPAYVITSMVTNQQSYFTDEYSGLHKGLVQIIKFKRTNDNKLNEQVKNDFLKVWKEIDCFLYQNEHKKIVENVWNKKSNEWDKLLTFKEKNINGKFKLRGLIQNYTCGIITLPENQKDKANCLKCQNLIANSN